MNVANKYFNDDVKDYFYLSYEFDEGLVSFPDVCPRLFFPSYLSLLMVSFEVGIYLLVFLSEDKIEAD